MDGFLSKRPEITPTATCSSSAGMTLQANINASNESVSRKRLSESAVERRHAEKMARQDRFLNLFEKLVDKYH